MMRRRSIVPIAVCAVAATLSSGGCTLSEGDAVGSSGQPGTSGSGQAGSSGLPTAGSSNGGTGGALTGAGGTGTGGTAGATSGGAATAGGGGTATAGTGGVSTSGTGGMGGAGGGASVGMSTGCGKMPTIASGMYNNGTNIPITAANMQRRYVLSVPASYDNKKPYKLIIAWHQRDGNDNQMYKNQYYHLQPLSNDTTIFVAPNGQLNGKPCAGTGNGEGSCGWPNTNDSDMALADAVVKQVEENFCVDTSRIFATGWSYGGSMSYATACERPLGAPNGFVRAIAVYSGAQLSGQCTPSMPVGYYASHGTSDSVLNYNSGIMLAQNFAKANGCMWMTPTNVTSGNHVCTDLMGCKSGYPEQFCGFNGDHTPDPRDPNQQSSWEYENVWKFFSQF